MRSSPDARVDFIISSSSSPVSLASFPDRSNVSDIFSIISDLVSANLSPPLKINGGSSLMLSPVFASSPVNTVPNSYRTDALETYPLESY
jgi:hypothetical protein